jgi:hypothetical protein
MSDIFFRSVNSHVDGIVDGDVSLASCVQVERDNRYYVRLSIHHSPYETGFVKLDKAGLLALGNACLECVGEWEE